MQYYQLTLIHVHVILLNEGELLQDCNIQYRLLNILFHISTCICSYNKMDMSTFHFNVNICFSLSFTSAELSLAHLTTPLLWLTVSLVTTISDWDPILEVKENQICIWSFSREKLWSCDRHSLLFLPQMMQWMWGLS